MLARLLNPVLPLPHTSVTFRGETTNEMSPEMCGKQHMQTHDHDLRVDLVEAISLSSIAITPRFELVEKKARASSQSQLEKNQVYKPQLSSFWNWGCR
jgi:hypothetical protein